jgi:hypothetical protein
MTVKGKLPRGTKAGIYYGMNRALRSYRRPNGLVLVPKLGLGMPLFAKLSLATIFVPKCNLGTSGRRSRVAAGGMRFTFPPYAC